MLPFEYQLVLLGIRIHCIDEVSSSKTQGCIDIANEYI